ncbi:hypothetical protein DN397_28390 [Bacillus sp. AY1-10]|nr:hypothetical protein DN397_28390 [Bacillus sp. AY1-10]TBX84770.1 hypothetical protein E0M29_25500 [Bacillus cereus]
MSQLNLEKACFNKKNFPNALFLFVLLSGIIMLNFFENYNSYLREYNLNIKSFRKRRIKGFFLFLQRPVNSSLKTQGKVNPL